MIQSRLYKLALRQLGGQSSKAPDWPRGPSLGGLDPKLTGSSGPEHVLDFTYTVTEGGFQTEKVSGLTPHILFDGEPHYLPLRSFILTAVWVLGERPCQYCACKFPLSNQLQLKSMGVFSFLSQVSRPLS